MYPYASLNDPNYPSFQPPRPKRRRELRGDPYAAVIGNATLLGIGYLLLGRRKAAVMAFLGTVWFLLFVVVAPADTVPRAMLLLWWIATVLHTFWIVRPKRVAAAEAPLVDFHGRESAWQARVFAGAVVLLAAMAIGGVRFDAAQIVAAAEAAHRDGDCEGAEAALTQFDITHRVADRVLAGEARANGEACDLLLAAMDEAGDEHAATTLESYMDHPGALWEGAGPVRAQRLLESALDPLDENSRFTIEEAFDLMAAVLDESPGQSRAVREVAEGFVDELAGHQSDGCVSEEVDEWLLAQGWERPELSEPVAAVGALVPPAALECAREHFETGMLTGAQDRYEEFLAEFPDHELAAEAAQELEEVEAAIEREEVSDLLDRGEYCGSPASYRGAEAYSGSGTNPMQLFGLDSSAYDLPDSWTTTDVDETVLVVCVSGPERGGFIESCEYEDFDGSYLGSVDFYANAFTIEAYELKTGERIADYTAEIGGSCPYLLTYYGGLASEQNVSYSPSDLRDLFERLQ